MAVKPIVPLLLELSAYINNEPVGGFHPPLREPVEGDVILGVADAYLRSVIAARFRLSAELDDLAGTSRELHEKVQQRIGGQMKSLSGVISAAQDPELGRLVAGYEEQVGRYNKKAGYLQILDLVVAGEIAARFADSLDRVITVDQRWQIIACKQSEKRFSGLEELAARFGGNIHVIEL